MNAFTRILTVAFTLALILATGCGPTLFAVTPPPPTRTAYLESKLPLFSKRKHFAHVSTGVALGFQCVNGRPCRNVRATIDDPSVVKIVPAHLARLEVNPLTMDHTPATTLVLIGLAPGETTVRLDSSDGSTTLAVTVHE